MYHAECHQYEPKHENFESCNVTTMGAESLTRFCYECPYNTFTKEASIKIVRENKPSQGNECPMCGGGPLYQDRLDHVRQVAHCDDCGEEVLEEDYKRIVAETRDGNIGCGAMCEHGHNEISCTECH